jgi:hypothetical protein
MSKNTICYLSLVEAVVVVVVWQLDLHLPVPITTKVVISNLIHHDTTLCNKVCQWFSPVSSTNITEILLKVALNTINPCYLSLANEVKTYYVYY